MINVEGFVAQLALDAVVALYGDVNPSMVQIQATRKEFEGDYTMVTFPLLKLSRKSPEQTANELGEYIVSHSADVESYNVIKGFLNLSLTSQYWSARFADVESNEMFGLVDAPSERTIMVEYSSPNTNKPLHLGHIRNNLLGWSVAEILKANGHKVLKVNLVNDRGIHICKSMLAWQLYGNGETPASSGMKGDHLVGKYYVEFDKHYKAQVKELIEGGASEDDAKRDAPVMQAAQAMLRKWEEGDSEVRTLWEMMNGWVYEGFDVTYKSLGVDFNKVYYESQTYLLGKKLVEDGLARGIFHRKEDGSVWIDLREDGLDEKLLLRGDGTSVYMTQDLGTAVSRFDEEALDDMIYVVGNEQNYHFDVLKLILGKLGYEWSKNITHLSYGMVELPNGRMKSREGTVVDADDLIAGMVDDAREISQSAGKTDGLSEAQICDISTMVGLGALKYFILKVDPKKTMLFDPAESIDFNGNTGPFVQYTHARICSLLRKAEEQGLRGAEYAVCGDAERELIKQIIAFEGAVRAAGDSYSPSIIAAYGYELAKMYNGYYHDHPMLKESDDQQRNLRLALSYSVARTLRQAMSLLGITVPQRM
ncbi:MAG: arginine--tRNA ligase [Rikenellaceae bacterium]